MMKKDILSGQGLSFDKKKVLKRPSLFGRSSSALRLNKNSHLNATAKSMLRSPSALNIKNMNDTDGSINIVDISVHLDMPPTRKAI